MSIIAQVGKISSYVALAFGTFFFIFAIKYYIAILLALFGGRNVKINVNNAQNSYRLFNRINKRFFRNHNRDTNCRRQDWFSYPESLRGDCPFVSIHLPFFNEKNVARRIIDACITIDYNNYEILVLDDSKDETIEILRELARRKGPPTIKVVHRKNRRGFKGGALSEGVKYMDPRTEYIVVFDADFIPQPDIIKQFLWYFKTENRDIVNKDRNCGKFNNYMLSNPNNEENIRLKDEHIDEGVEEGHQQRRIAVVQGYQRHHLNKSENWITRGVRAEYSGSYMIERPAEEYFGTLKMISGSVFMIRADVVKQLGWTTSITEDWELTLRLYLAGYKVMYTPLIQASAEIPTTIRWLARQRTRWAEGHTFVVKKYFWSIIKSRSMTLREKLEFLYFAPYYLQSFLFLTGSMCWAIGEFLHKSPHFWTATLGWCLILNNLFSLPLMSLAGLFLERSAIEDFTGILSFIVLSYILAPIQAYAALKGLLEKKEGAWIRTLKTGTITDKILGMRFRRLFYWIGPEKRIPRPAKRHGRHSGPLKMAFFFLILLSAIIGRVTVAAMSIDMEELIKIDLSEIYLRMGGTID